MKQFQFDLFRLSLRSRTQIDFDEYISPMSREDWIRQAFSLQVSFRHHGSEFAYVPVSVKNPGKYIFGKIGRSTESIENMPPESKLQEVKREVWKASTIVIDPTNHEDGQKLAMQYSIDVGKPNAVLPRLIQSMEREFKSSQYYAAIHPITNTEAFWEFAERNKNQITRIHFELEVPNMFGGEDEYTKEMRAFRDEEKAQRVIFELRSREGINTDSDRIRYTAEKAMAAGTGRLTATAKGRNNRFSSAQKQLSIRLKIEEIEQVRDELDISAALASKVLGHDKDRP